MKPFYISHDSNFVLYQDDSLKVIKNLPEKFDMVFADPPYFLSNDGLSIQSGKIVSVNKGIWDKSQGQTSINNFNRKWLKQIKNILKENGTVWISGTLHNIFSIAQILEELDFKILNAITWEKSNPPPNFSCRFFTHSTEIILWARKSKKVAHYYNYELMKFINGGKQMRDVWRLPAIAPWEKKHGKHPTQKPLSVLTRIILASTRPGDLILDPFTGSSTTGIAANLLKRKFVGIDLEQDFLKISIERKLEIEHEPIRHQFLSKIAGFSSKNELLKIVENEPFLK